MTWNMQVKSFIRPCCQSDFKVNSRLMRGGGGGGGGEKEEGRRRRDWEILLLTVRNYILLLNTGREAIMAKKVFGRLPPVSIDGTTRHIAWGSGNIRRRGGGIGAPISLNTILTLSGNIDQTVLPPEIVFSSPSPSTATARFRLDNCIASQG